MSIFSINSKKDIILVSSITGKPLAKPWATFLTDAYSRRLLAVHVSKELMSTLPEELGQLRSLRLLKLERNPLQTLPKELGQLRNLKHLSVSKYLSFQVPEELAQRQDVQITMFYGPVGYQ